MPARATAPPGAPCWVNLLTSDAERSRGFYSQVFGWTATEPQEQFGGYFNFSSGGALVAGGMPKQPGMEAPDTWSVYLATDDVQKTLESADGARRPDHPARHAGGRPRHDGHGR